MSCAAFIKFIQFSLAMVINPRFTFIDAVMTENVSMNCFVWLWHMLWIPPLLMEFLGFFCWARWRFYSVRESLCLFKICLKAGHCKFTLFHSKGEMFSSPSHQPLSRWRHNSPRLCPNGKRLMILCCLSSYFGMRNTIAGSWSFPGAAGQLPGPSSGRPTSQHEPFSWLASQHLQPALYTAHLQHRPSPPAR